MRNYQTFFMLLITLAVGALFMIRRPNPQNQQIANLQTLTAGQAATIAFWERQPTDIPSPTPPSGPSSTPSPLPSPTPAPGLGPVILATLPNAQSNPPTDFIRSTGARIVSVQASLSVDAAGCAISPATNFAPSDTIYGVVTLADVAAGDQLAVRFSYQSDGGVIYEDQFSIQEGGSFCRWYTVQPDELGWEAGSYLISYQLNGAAPSELIYNIGAGAALPAPTADAMTNDQ
jgi:hypothetical protein